MRRLKDEMRTPVRRAARWSAHGILAGLTLAMAIPSTVQAAEPVTGGVTTLKVNRATVEALADNGIELTAAQPAEASESGAIELPIVDGKLETDPKVAGTVEHTGGLKLAMGSAKISAKDLELTIGTRSKLIAKIGSERIGLFKVDIDSAEADVGDGVVSISKLKPALSNAGANALNEALETDLLLPGTPFGKVSSEIELVGGGTGTNPEGVVRLGGGATTLTLDPEAAAALADENIGPAPVDPATSEEEGLIVFPISRGKVDVESVEASVRHSGGLELSKGAKAVQLLNPKLTLGDESAVSFKVGIGGERLPILAVDAEEARTKLTETKAKVSKLEGALTEEAAAALDEGLGVTLFEEGLTLGTLTLRGAVIETAEEAK